MAKHHQGTDPGAGPRPQNAAMQAIPDNSYLAYTRPVPRPFLQFVSGHFPPGTVTQSHSHPCVALHGCLKGPLTLIADGQEMSVDEGVFYILAPGIKHHWHNAGRQTAATIGLLVDTEHPGRWPKGAGVEQCCQKLAQAATAVHRFAVAGDDELRHLFWLAGDHLTAADERETTALVGVLLALVGQCVARLTSTPKQTAMPDKLAQEIRRLLLARVNDRLRISDVAGQLGVSPTRAKEAFRKAFGCGIVTYQNELKIWQAKRLLCDLSLTVDEVSSRLGFSSHSYFSQVFLQHTGETPTEFRRRDMGSA
jgi:AraC-like DNA-binding protein/quercetin dioxygenase-like cupin family protein